MAEFIEREKALSAQNKSMNLSEMRERLKRIPAADVRTVVHGKWIEYPEVLKLTDALNDEYIGCSVCENVWNMMDNDVERFNYCPNCGAWMEER